VNDSHKIRQILTGESADESRTISSIVYYHRPRTHLALSADCITGTSVGQLDEVVENAEQTDFWRTISWAKPLAERTVGLSASVSSMMVQ
jgi:hypothetical protein